MVFGPIIGAGLGALAGVGVGSVVFSGDRPKDYGFIVEAADRNDNIRTPAAANVTDEMRNIVPLTPEWTTWPDYDRWVMINRLIRLMWPKLTTAILKQVIVTVKPIIQNILNGIPGVLGILDDITLGPYSLMDAEHLDPHITEKYFTLGNHPVRVAGMKVYHTNDDSCIIETPAIWGSNMVVDVQVYLRLGPVRLVVPVSVSHVTFKAVSRITLDMVDTVPCIGGATVSLLSVPHVDFVLRLFNGPDLMALPGIKEATKFIIGYVMKQVMLYPNSVSVPLMTNYGVPPPPKGMVHVTLQRIENLKTTDFLTKGDPYVVFEIREGRQQRSKTVKSSNNPTYNEEFFLLVDDLVGQNLSIKVYDYDRLCPTDDLLGTAEVFFTTESIQGDAATGQKLVYEEADWIKSPMSEAKLALPLQVAGGGLLKMVSKATVGVAVGAAKGAAKTATSVASMVVGGVGGEEAADPSVVTIKVAKPAKVVREEAEKRAAVEAAAAAAKAANAAAASASVGSANAVCAADAAAARAFDLGVEWTEDDEKALWAEVKRLADEKKAAAAAEAKRVKALTKEQREAEAAAKKAAEEAATAADLAPVLVEEKVKLRGNGKDPVPGAKPVGTMYLTLRYMPLDAPRFDDDIEMKPVKTGLAAFIPFDPAPAREIASNVNDFQRGVLCVTVIKASALGSPGGVAGALLNPDPYVEMILVDCDRTRPSETQKTSVKRNDPTPRWCETFDFVMVSAGSMLTLNVMNKVTLVDAVASLKLSKARFQDAALGKVQIPVADVARNGQLKDTWALQNAESGTIELKLTWHNTYVDQYRRAPASPRRNARRGRSSALANVSGAQLGSGPRSMAPRRTALGLLLLAAGAAAAAAQAAGDDLREQQYEHCAAQKFTYAMPPRGTPPPPLKMVSHRLVNAVNNKVVSIRGINWFGFNVGMGMVDGLWAGGSAAATDFALITYQLRLLGYNAVRLPFTWRDLNMSPRSFHKDCAPVSVDFLRKRLTSPHVQERYGAKPLPGNGMYVVLDYQPMGLENHAYDLAAFVEAWEGLWRQVSCLPNFQRDLANRVFVDVMNEPDSMSIRWEATADRPGAAQLYLSTADALWGLSPGKVMFFFEGTGQNMFGLNWGNGFITNMDIINGRGLSDPNPFFAALVRKPYADRTVITPHIYPPSITMATFLGTALWEQCAASFGYLQTTGYCAPGGGRCTRFPVLVGEVGSAFETATDKQWLQDFADFVNAEGGAKAYNAAPLSGWLWWAYNENSGDTGGIVMNEWQDVNWEKVNWMVARLGLRPWRRCTDRDRCPASAAAAARPARRPGAMEREVARWLHTQLGYNAAADATLAANCRGNLKGLWEFLLANYKTPEAARHVQAVLAKHRREAAAAAAAPERRRQAAEQRAALAALEGQAAALQRTLASFQAAVEGSVHDAAEQHGEARLARQELADAQMQALVLRAASRRVRELLPQLRARLAKLQSVAELATARCSAPGGGRRLQATLQQLQAVSAGIRGELIAALEGKLATQTLGGLGAAPAGDAPPRAVPADQAAAAAPGKDGSGRSWEELALPAAPGGEPHARCSPLSGYAPSEALRSAALVLLQEPPEALLACAGELAAQAGAELATVLDEAEGALLAPLGWGAGGDDPAGARAGGDAAAAACPFSLPWTTAPRGGTPDARAGGRDQGGSGFQPPELLVRARQQMHVQLYVQARAAAAAAAAADADLTRLLGSTPVLQQQLAAGGAGGAGWEAELAGLWLRAQGLRGELGVLEQRKREFEADVDACLQAEAQLQEKWARIEAAVATDQALNRLLWGVASHNMSLFAALCGQQDGVLDLLRAQLAPAGGAAAAAAAAGRDELAREAGVVARLPVAALAPPRRLAAGGDDAGGGGPAGPATTLARLHLAAQRVPQAGRPTTVRKPLVAAAGEHGGAAGAGLHADGGAAAEPVDGAAVAALRAAAAVDAAAPVRCPAALLLEVADECQQLRQLQAQLERLGALSGDAAASGAAAAEAAARLEEQVGALRARDQQTVLPWLQAQLEAGQAARAHARAEVAADIAHFWEMPAQRLLPQLKFAGKSCGEWLNEVQALHGRKRELGGGA
ncbi:SYT1 [Scenedesmus sp. PABB004]|nr:SYT1 [Scenedesmus sp. PABB004]